MPRSVIPAQAGIQDDYYSGHDHLYSPTVLFDPAGNVVERYEYDAYGKANILSSNYSLLTSSQFENPYLFTGRRLDTMDSGSLTIYHYRARAYDPETGRFMQWDPLGYVDAMSLYEYVRCNPTFYLDALGLMGKDVEDIICEGLIKEAGSLAEKVFEKIFDALEKPAVEKFGGGETFEPILLGDTKADCKAGQVLRKIVIATITNMHAEKRDKEFHYAPPPPEMGFGGGPSITPPPGAIPYSDELGKIRRQRVRTQSIMLSKCVCPCDHWKTLLSVSGDTEESIPWTEEKIGHTPFAFIIFKKDYHVYKLKASGCTEGKVCEQ